MQNINYKYIFKEYCFLAQTNCDTETRQIFMDEFGDKKIFKVSGRRISI